MAMSYHLKIAKIPENIQQGRFCAREPHKGANPGLPHTARVPLMYALWLVGTIVLIKHLNVCYVTMAVDCSSGICVLAHFSDLQNS